MILFMIVIISPHDEDDKNCCYQYHCGTNDIDVNNADDDNACNKANLILTTNNNHYDDVIMDSIASQITSLTIVYSTFHSGADQSKHQSSASLAFVWEIQRWPVNFPHKWPVTRKMFPFDDVIMHNVDESVSLK